MPVAGSVNTGPPGRPAMSMRAYSGQPWPEPSVTRPETVTTGWSVNAKSSVATLPSTAVTVADFVPYPYFDAVTVWSPAGTLSEYLPSGPVVVMTLSELTVAP